MSQLSDVVSERDLLFLRDSAGALLAQLAQVRRVVRKELRPWPDFFAVFKPPSDSLAQRVVGNVNHFWSNYLVVAGAVFAVRVLFAPLLLFSLLAVLAFALYTTLYLDEIQVSRDVSLSGWSKQVACWAVCLVFLGLTRALEHILWSALLVLLLCGAHMVFRPRSVTAAADATTEFRLHGIDSLFSSDPALRDPETGAPMGGEEELFLNGYSGVGRSVRKRHH